MRMKFLVIALALIAMIGGTSSADYCEVNLEYDWVSAYTVEINARLVGIGDGCSPHPDDFDYIGLIVEATAREGTDFTGDEFDMLPYDWEEHGDVRNVDIPEEMASVTTNGTLEYYIMLTFRQGDPSECAEISATGMSGGDPLIVLHILPVEHEILQTYGVAVRCYYGNDVWDDNPAWIDSVACGEPSTATCPDADVNCDNVANGLDISAIQSLANWGKSVTTAANRATDVDDSGTVNGLDVSQVQLRACWGK